jgi:hypothetical protein
MTIAQQLKIKDFPFVINDKDGKVIYYENSDGFWSKREYDANSKKIYWENSDGDWFKREYDGHILGEYDSLGNRIYYENSNGYIEDNRPKTVEVSLEDIAKQMGINVTQLRIKD